ncbi:hypothetical protein GCM10012288_21560 [Malaciobacter pacificus]|uniref:ribonuclease H n=1 Tax=Malaciobacter pacificus TaxID=1080223 RepID=A0A5C2H9M3_9BACT|nr:ribonuclease H [Malaciobacter pacificus]QEP35039.1 ribonuclease HI [Malaciobacter pacificus]GGD46993.1 hypothetical protein GCM10012288_21560 [Malaciobacter pacificus]
MIKINEDFAENILFNDTLNKAQCEVLDISYPLQNGWENELLNKEISSQDAELLILLTGKIALKAQEQIIKNYKRLQEYKLFIKENSTSENILPIDSSSIVTIYCDGACKGNPGNAGSGVAVYNDDIITLYSGLFIEYGTNNIAELNALKKALEISQNCNETIIYSDSMYAIDCITKWGYTWKKNDWTKKGGEIKNLELIKEVHNLYDNMKDKVIIKHVKGHSGVEGNELADRMAVNAINSKEESFIKFEFKNINNVLKMESF